MSDRRLRDTRYRRELLTCDFMTLPCAGLTLKILRTDGTGRRWRRIRCLFTEEHPSQPKRTAAAAVAAFRKTRGSR